VASADLCFVDRVHIRFCGDGGYRFRFYSESLGKAPSNQGLLPLSFGASLWLGMPSLRPCSVGPPPSAIHAGLPTAQNLHSAYRGGGASRSKAAGELTLGLLSGKKQKLYTDLLYVGAGLLAKGPCQSTSMADVSPLSRASPLPHFGFLSGTGLEGSVDELRERVRRLGRPVGRLAFAFDLLAPSEGRGGSAQWAPRQGCRGSRPRPWMADGGGPTEQDRSEGMPSLGEAPYVRGKSVWLLGAFPSDSL